MTKIKINCNSKPHNNHAYHNQCLQIQTSSTWCICVLFYSKFVCMSAYANVYLCKCIRQINIHRSEVHCGRAFEPGGSVLPYYCSPPVCIPAVLGAPAVWRFSKKKKTWSWWCVERSPGLQNVHEFPAFSHRFSLECWYLRHGTALSLQFAWGPGDQTWGSRDAIQWLRMQLV